MAAVLVDTHAHLDDEAFHGRLEDVLQRAGAAGVRWILAVGYTAASSEACVALAARRSELRAAVGIQPNYCGDAAPADWDRIVRLARRPETAAIGETGLDRHWNHAPLDVQQDYFDRHLQLAQQLDLPVVIHMREAEEETARMVEQARRRGPLAGVMHAFTGDADLAARMVDLGLHISFAGMVTYKKSEALRRTAAAIPADRILVETDAPYLTPEPFRGRRPNEPALLPHIAARLAEVRGEPLAQFASQTTASARRLFRFGQTGESDG